jgi:hypothetical protein
LCSFVI